MGKYIRKSKAIGEVALMEVSHAESSRGVLTRAKTLALRRLRTSSAAAEPPHSLPTISYGSYLQLRSRRLEKPPDLVAKSEAKRQKHLQKQSILQKLNPNPGSIASSRASSRLKVGGSGASVSLNYSTKEKVCFDSQKKVVVEEENIKENDKKEISGDRGIEASFGENVLESEGRERSTWETTHCSSIRNPDTIKDSGFTMKPTSLSEANRRTKNSVQRNIPTARDIDEFLTCAEERHQKQFIEKYNFDPVKEKPLPGRYEWVKTDSSKC